MRIIVIYIERKKIMFCINSLFGFKSITITRSKVIKKTTMRKIKECKQKAECTITDKCIILINVITSF